MLTTDIQQFHWMKANKLKMIKIILQTWNCLLQVSIFSEQNKDYSDTLDFRSVWVGEVTFLFWRSPAMIIYSIVSFTQRIMSSWSCSLRVVKCDESVTELLVRSHDKVAVCLLSISLQYFVSSYSSYFWEFFYQFVCSCGPGFDPARVVLIFFIFQLFNGILAFKFFSHIK